MSSSAELNSLLAGIRPGDENARVQAQKQWAACAKPLGSLGLLEDALTDMAALTGSPVPEHDDIPAKRQMIIQNGLAVWDVIRSCEIIGASDASIRNVEPNDLAALIAELGVERVVCNGSTSARLYRKYALPHTGLEGIALPSTSPANAAWSLPRLEEAWSAILPFL